MKLYYAILSGEHPTLPLSELRAILETYSIGSVVYSFEGVAIYKWESGDALLPARIGGFIKEVGELMAIVEAEQEEVDKVYRRIPPDYRVESRRFRGYGRGVRLPQRRGVQPGVRFFLTEGVVVVGRIMARHDTKSFESRRPGKRPFFKPGPLSPQLSRALVNISRARPGSFFLDPFCGTGGFVLEACLVGSSPCACLDIQADMVAGSRVNLEHYKVYDRCIVARADAASMPIADDVVDAIATDPPYGRSTTTAKRTYQDLARLFLAEASRVLHRGSYLVYAGPADKEPWLLAKEYGFDVVERHHMHVHSSLTREIVVAVKR